MTIAPERLAELDKLVLDEGAHESWERGACVMGWWLDRDWSHCHLIRLRYTAARAAPTTLASTPKPLPPHKEKGSSA